ncbi:MAG: hypothetical protein U0R19_11100 [Bryobacteraceae bacterium]
MKLTFLLLAIAAMASAAPVTYNVSGNFDTGGTFSGWFTLDGSTNSITESNITTTADPGFPSVTYTSSGTGSPYIQGNDPSVPSDFSVLFFGPTGGLMFFWLSGTPQTFSGGPILALGLSCNACTTAREYNASFEARLITGGLAEPAPAPEPATGAIAGVAMGAYWLVRRNRRSCDKQEWHGVIGSSR